MQYFVSAENSSYFYWQLELLIESFLMQGMEKSLVVALAENDDQKIMGYSHNLVKHDKKFMMSNEGRQNGYLPANRINAIRNLINHGVLELPFVMIHADMILKSPLVLSEYENQFGMIVNNFDDFSGDETLTIKEETDALVEVLAVERDVEAKDIPRIPFFSAPVVFNKPMEYVAEPFFSKVQMHEANLVAERGPKFPCERCAWELAVTECFQHFSIMGKLMSVPMMSEGETASFIHYRSGIPPVFHKKYFKYENGNYFSSAGPYETIMEHNPTQNTNYVQQVIRSYDRRHNRSIR
jgi:hypothetical protein